MLNFYIQIQFYLLIEYRNCSWGPHAWTLQQVNKQFDNDQIAT